MDETKVNALINIGQSKIAEKVYDDIVSDPSKKAGSALGTIVNIGNTVLWPIKWVNERTRIYFENNLRKYEEQLSKIPEEKIVEVPTEISMPILERFTYTSNEELSNAFVNLLTSASSIDDINKAHPGFIQIIDRLSPDEALLLKYLINVDSVAALTIRYHKDFMMPEKKSQYVDLLENVTLLEKRVDLKFSENIAFYLDNLCALGLLQAKEEFYTSLENDFIEIEELHKEYLDIVFNVYNNDELKKAKTTLKKMYEKTYYGKLFIQACIK